MNINTPLINTETYLNPYIREINKCEIKITEEELKIADSQFNINVFTEYMVSMIKNIIPIISNRCLDLVWRNMNDLKDKDEKKFKSNYSYIIDVIKEHIIGDTKCTYKKTKLIDSIVKCGYGEYGYSIYFYVNNIKFCFTVPVTEHINKENLTYAYNGKYNLTYTTTGSCYYTLSTSYKLEDLHKAFKEFIESGCKE